LPAEGATGYPRSGCPNNCRRSEAEKDSPCSKLEGIHKLKADAQNGLTKGACGGPAAPVVLRVPKGRLWPREPAELLMPLQSVIRLAYFLP